MRAHYLAVAGRIRRELEELRRLVSRITDIWREREASSDYDYRVDAVALNLHGYYAGLERLFELVAARVDRTELSGEHWHQELLDQMAWPCCRIRRDGASTGIEASAMSCATSTR